MATYLDFEKPIAELESKLAELRSLNDGENAVSISEEIIALAAEGEGCAHEHLYQADAVAEDAGGPPPRASAYARLCEWPGRGFHADGRRPLLRRGRGHHRRRRPHEGPHGRHARTREGLGYGEPHQAQLRHGASGRISQGRAPDGPRRQISAAGGDVRRHGGRLPGGGRGGTRPGGSHRALDRPLSVAGRSHDDRGHRRGRVGRRTGDRHGQPRADARARDLHRRLARRPRHRSCGAMRVAPWMRRPT